MVRCNLRASRGGEGGDLVTLSEQGVIDTSSTGTENWKPGLGF